MELQPRRYSYTEKRTLVWDPGRPLFVVETGGTIFVRGYREDNIEIKAIRTAFAETLEAARKNARLVKPLIEAPRGEISIRTQKPETWNGVNEGYVDYSLEVPRDISMELNTEEGTIRAVDLNGAVSARTASGSVYFDGLGGPANAETETGRIEIHNSPGFLRAVSVSGDVAVALDAAPSSSPIFITTVNGKVELKFPRDLGLTVKVVTSDGEVDDFDSAVSEYNCGPQEFPQNPPGARYSCYRNAGGGPEVIVRTDSGDVRLVSKASIQQPLE